MNTKDRHLPFHNFVYELEILFIVFYLAHSSEWFGSAPNNPVQNRIVKRSFKTVLCMNTHEIRSLLTQIYTYLLCS